MAGLLVVFGSLPWGWHEVWANVWASNEAMAQNIYLADALLILIEVGVIGCLLFGAFRLLQQHTLPGLRAGIFFAAIYVSLALVLVGWLGSHLDTDATIGFIIMAGGLAVLIGLAGYFYLMVPGWRGLLETVERKAGFTAPPIKVIKACASGAARLSAFW